MTRIEKTQINTSALIILSSTLKKVESDRIIEIVDDGKRVVNRPKEMEEKKDFRIDLNFLDRLFKATVMGGPEPLIVDKEAEKYLRNCSYACYYYRDERERMNEFDHFNLFHSIHFPNLAGLNLDEDIIKQFCKLFRIDTGLCLPFINCQKNLDNNIKLPPKLVFNQVFKSLKLSEENDAKVLYFETYLLNGDESLDTLFAIKDLLSCRKIDTKSIPEYDQFSIQQDEEVIYTFISQGGMEIKISFKYDGLNINMKKTCV